MEEKIKFNYSRLRGKITEKYNSISNFARAFGKDYLYLYRRLSGQAEFTASDIFRIANLLELGNLEDYFFDVEVK